MITIGIVCAQFNTEITDEMLRFAEERAKELGIRTITVRCPGSFDLPLFAQQLLQDKNIRGVVTLGAIVTGETDHDQLIAYTATEKLAQLSLTYGKPVTLGITGPKQTYEQAVARIPRAADIVDACVHMITELDNLRQRLGQ